MTLGPLTLTAAGPPMAGATALESLLHPLTPARFRAEYWQRRPVHLTGWPGRLAGTFDRAALRRALSQQEATGISVRVSRDHEGDGGGAGAHVLVDAADVADHLRLGASVCVDPIDRADPVLARLAASFRSELGHLGPVAVRCYLSTPGYGFNTHFDAHVVTTLQVEGTKRWRVSRTPTVPYPLDNAFLDTAGAIRYVGRTPRSLRPWEAQPLDRGDVVEILLEPGDVLCLPAGTWHEAKAVGKPSLALNFSFAPADVLGLLLAAVRPTLQDGTAWRAGFPTGEGTHDYVRERVAELVDALQSLAGDTSAMSTLVGTAADATALSVAGHDPAAAAHAAAHAAGLPLAGHRVQCLLGVEDAQKAADWYGRVLGSRVVSTIPEFGWVEVSTAVPGLTLGLTELPTAVSNRGGVLDFEVDDVERIRAVLATNGVSVTEAATEIAGVARILTAHDLDGNRLMFFEPHDDGRTE